MFVKVYTYHVQPEHADRCRAIQERADELYAKHVDSRTNVLRSRENSRKWMEIHWYSDEATHDRAMEKIKAEPEIERLQDDFKATLDPNFPDVREEQFTELVSGNDNLR